MNARQTLSNRHGLLAPKSSQPRAIVVYDTIASRLKAIELYPHLSHRAGVELRYSESQWWHFDRLSTRERINEAVELAKGTDLIMLATFSCEHLPDFVEQWIREALSDEEGMATSTFVALLMTKGRPGTRPYPTERFLEHRTRRAGIKLLLQIVELGETCPVSSEEILRRYDTTTEKLEQIIHHHVKPCY